MIRLANKSDKKSYILQTDAKANNTTTIGTFLCPLDNFIYLKTFIFSYTAKAVLKPKITFS